ncbi:hypothetical protein T459_02472 [Capsicum annuum]|uniref:Peptidase S9 prolyl oligopeptidase catalytic domain-containing protein n=1 Tax=Capsicum annuum TaxID=4072 RepID=A0A2G3AK64_CAPAN|nr:hypothetical protein T459_02472 [Capsicum annuum]
MQVRWKTDRWLQKHCVYTSDVKADLSTCKDNAEGTVDLQSRPAGGAQELANLDDDKFHSYQKVFIVVNSYFMKISSYILEFLISRPHFTGQMALVLPLFLIGLLENEVTSYCLLFKFSFYFADLGVCFVNAGLNRYIEQLVASAEAAVEEVIRRGVSDPNKIAVGGHSYWAFMTANLLAHAPHLFSCGIAISGAYNRTLTPFGFQNEERTLWEATHTYVEMSPFMSANKNKKPILLIHGEEDNNPGTLTMQIIQSDSFFNALKGHGALCRLVILPYKSHDYSARESIMHVLWETDRWLQKHCVYSSDVKLQFNKKKLLGDEARSTCCNLDV